MADLYLSVADPVLVPPASEGGPYTVADIRVNGEVVATWTNGAWFINDGCAFGSEELTETSWPIILGQAK